MGETPRTDEYLRRRKENGHTVVVSIEFARQLEIELAAAIAELRELQNKGKKREVKCKIADCERKAAILKLDKERCMSWTEG